MLEFFETWNRSIAEAMRLLRQPDFPRAVEAALAALVEHDIVMVFAYAGAERPVCLHHNMAPDRAATVIRDYVRGPYLLDPFYGAAAGPERCGVLRLRDLAPDLFYNSEYFKRHYVRTRIRDEVGFLVRPAAGTGVVLSITRPMDRPAFSARDMQAIRAAEPVLRTLAEAHWQDWRPGPAERPPAPAGKPIDLALDRMAGGLLTPREIEITAMVLRGHSSGSIAAILGISEGTVKIHRKNIYHKLAVASQADLFSRFIQHL
ncbi:helix-turn-helix transcriptional regulator [Labrys wisconsinensis]|uniref:DNA-binding CsgD family transcriptional regulator n=1 Tax=Labrys wisconsinensis TaxID=425677 RepID=A0ABU0J049_9HYPH|nr:helix-turn-helix transcriptional regulator [Labrys wisconsinensis]MDQ0467629.1 DNA-binding CsgD family transcriptional regulator [Labrys wisconsinensis]